MEIIKQLDVANLDIPANVRNLLAAKNNLKNINNPITFETNNLTSTTQNNAGDTPPTTAPSRR